MKEANKKQQFTCKDNYLIEVYLGMLIFGILIGVSVIFGVTYGVCNNYLMFVPGGLFLLIWFLTLSIFSIVFSTYMLCKNKTCIFSIDNSRITLVGKRYGENLCIERNIEDIKSIVIKSFRKYPSIIFVDTIGELGKSPKTLNGQFIKINYSKRRLENIKKYLPECPIRYSDNTTMDELF